MNNEIKMAFELAYLPLAHARHRINGKDFIGVAVPLMDYVREQTSDLEKIRDAAETIVLSFNELLNPHMPDVELKNTVDLLVRNGQLTRTFALQAQRENQLWMARYM